MAATLEIQGVTKRFGGVWALSSVTATVPQGTVLGVIGPNGAGKSTLLNLISGQIAPSSGRILIDGQDFTGAPPWRLARAGVARTFQVMRPFEDLTARANVALSAMYARHLSKRQALPIADRMLDAVGLRGSADLPARQLPVAGVRQLELARALAAEPRLLVLDEVLAGMAGAELLKVMKVLFEVKDRGMTMVVVEHHLRAVLALCDQVIVLAGGRVVNSGPAGAVLGDPAVMRAYLGSEHRAGL